MKKPERRPLSRRLTIPVLLLISSVLLPAAGAAPGAASDKKPAPFAVIVGTVWSADDRPAPGVVVKIRRSDEKKPKWQLVSDGRGEFAQRVPAGSADYLVWAEVKGRKGPAAETKVHIENDERQDIGLHLTK